mmetsp:Transcript_7487/g.21871  ORF Transcript_7487/g.21871 Transcript_7487/m.21871 type:complete len:253 (-) Transcript_7487:1183-1941(-)
MLRVIFRSLRMNGWRPSVDVGKFDAFKFEFLIECHLLHQDVAGRNVQHRQERPLLAILPQLVQRFARAVLLHAAHDQRMMIIRIGDEGECGKASESGLRVMVIDLNDGRIRKVLIDEHDLVRSQPFVDGCHVLVLGDAARQEHPFLQMVGPPHGLLHQIAWILCMHHLPNVIVFGRPVLSSHLSVGRYYDNPQRCKAAYRSIAVGVLLPDAAQVQFPILDCGPFPLHALVGCHAIAFHEHSSWDNARRRPVI